MNRNVLFITVDQWRGDCLSCAGHDVVETPTIDSLASTGVLFDNHWANASPCGPSRACLFTGMYMQNHRSVLNGTPLDARFTNIALEVRRQGYDPVLFGYTDTSVDPRSVPAGDPRTRTYEGVLPGFTPIVHDPWEAGGLEWGKWLAGHGLDVPSKPHALYEPDTSYPGADDHGRTWAPALFPAALSETSFITEKVIEWMARHGEEPFFVHVSYIRPHPPRRNPAGYHDLYSVEQVGPFAGFDDPDVEGSLHPLNRILIENPFTASPRDDIERRQLRATYYGMQREVDDQLARLLGFVEDSGLRDSTLVVLTSDHGEMGGDHWLLEKFGYWDESFRIPLVVRDPTPAADATRGLAVHDFTESVDIAPTILDWLGLEVPAQVDGWPLTPFLRGGQAPEHWRTAAHFEWDFRHPALKWAESRFGIPSDHCSLAVARGTSSKLVQFGADPDTLPPLLFGLDEDPDQRENLAGRGTHAELELEMTQDLLRWRMRNAERTLANCYLDPRRGPVWARDAWR
ncbi:MAG TPA: alkaline phosphatase family protein [Acidimicrobiales bacterium]|nr:alkaline phosphatase family protein [Acidimicrobiales bacterium]